MGHTHSYSAALGYAVLARIMEVVDGKPWDTIMEDRLFDHLELTSTSSFDEQVDLPSRRGVLREHERPLSWRVVAAMFDRERLVTCRHG